MKKKKLKPNFVDQRGEITDILDNEKITSITIITFNKGAVRGNHFHKKTTQWNYVLDGKLNYYFQSPGKKICKLILNKGDLAISKINQRHAFKSFQKSRVLVLTKGPRSGENYESDTYRLKKPLIK